MIEAKQREIDGTIFEFMPLMATPARDMFDQLMKTFGPTLGSAINGMKTFKQVGLDDEVLTEMLPAVADVLGNAITGFTSAITPGYHKNLVDTFLKQVSYIDENGEKRGLTPALREVMFATSLATETKLLLFCLEVQYADFFGLLKKGAAYATLNLTKQGKSSGFPKASTGLSGE